MLTPRHHALIAADQLKGAPHASAKFYSASSDNVPVVIDSGASTSVTPSFDDFVRKCARLDDHKVDGFTEEAIIEGVGEVEWTVYDHHGNKGVIRTHCYCQRQRSDSLVPKPIHAIIIAMVLTKDYCLMDLKCGTKLKFIYDKYNDLPMVPTAPPFSSSSTLATVIDPLPEGVQVNAMLHDESNQNLNRAQKDLLH